MILQNVVKFNQNFSQNAKFRSIRSTELLFLLIACSKFEPKSIHQIAWFQFQKYKIFQLLRGHIPSQTLPPHTSKQAIGSVTPHQIIKKKNVKDRSAYPWLGGACNFEVGEEFGEGFGRLRRIVLGNYSDFLEEFNRHPENTQV